VSIRKFKRSDSTLEWLVKDKQSLSPAAAEYLRLMVRSHRNVVVSGGTGSGKTSLLNALSAAIPAHERVIVIEDSSELQLNQEHTVYLESRPAGPDGKGAVTIRDLFVDSLRMRPDRILVGEVRRGETLDLIQSMFSGHDGALTTVHASSPLLVLVRLETLCLMNDVGLPVYVARTQAASAVHVVAQVARLPDGSRSEPRIPMTAALTKQPVPLTAQLRRAYRRLMLLPARTRWAIGFAAPIVVMGTCLATAAVLPSTACRPTPVAGVLAWMLVASVVSDLLWRRIFNFVLGPALVWIGLLHMTALASLSKGLPSLGESAVGLGICFGLMLILYLTFRGGEGDVKLVAVLGAVLGWWHGVEAAVCAYLLAAAVAGMLVTTRLASRTIATSVEKSPLLARTLSMAPFFAAGVVFTLM
jgi:prepilin signal peptidase PulO-like enzyme (type II secretory pathway)